MDVMNLFNRWQSFPLKDEDLKKELNAVKDNEEEISDRFYRDLEFGTGGLRGVIGAGTNRMNIYTVKKATQGFANYLLKTEENPSVAISYDSRIKSDLFAKSAAEVFAANGIRVYIYNTLMPTPMLSFAVRELKTSAGVMITASHNPAKYNGYKAYGPDGCQLTLEAADAVLAEINKIDVLDGFSDSVFSEEIEKGTISYIGEEVIEKYYSCVLSQSVNKGADNSGVNIVYTPLNGTGNVPVREILKRIGIKNVSIVKEQENPDGNFTTCPYPNPEIKEALEIGIAQFERENADLLIATDPDADRVGTALIKNGKVRLISGNEMGVLLLWYIINRKKEMGTLPQNPIAVKTIVTTPMAKALTDYFGIELIDVLTGFKFIGEQIKFLEDKGEENRFLFGFEESYGYLSGTYVRDKDAVVAAMLIAEMTAYYKTLGKDLADVLSELYEKFGYFKAGLESFAFEGAEGMQIMNEKMAFLRENGLDNIAGKDVLYVSDYLKGETVYSDGKKEEITLPKSNVLVFGLQDDNAVVIRPSGTEPKIKIYLTAKGESEDGALEIIKELKNDFIKKASF
ncbi:MAG: phospho-sugar mutase [Oscillospiraceae bacterium]|nr:phospho-sugar mutase [Oscillospiraceae bacterium]